METTKLPEVSEFESNAADEIQQVLKSPKRRTSIQEVSENYVGGE